MTSLSPNEIRKIGLEALLDALGPVGMVRFMEQFDIGKGDYTKERKEWLDEFSINNIVEKLKEERKDQND